MSQLGAKIISRQTVKTHTSADQAWSRRQPVFHVVVLGCLTLNLYVLYWLYKTYRMLKADALRPELAEQHRALALFARIHPLRRTAALLLPLCIAAIPFVAGILKNVINDAILIYIFATLVIGVALLAPNQRSFARNHPLVSCGLVLGCSLLLRSFSKLSGPWFLLSLVAAVVPCAVVQHWLNEYLATTEQKNATMRTMFNAPEMVAVIIGAGVLGLIVAGMMMGIR